MQIIKVTNFVKKSEHGIHIYTKENKKIKVVNKTIDQFINENLIRLSSSNIQFLRKAAESKVQTEFYS